MSYAGRILAILVVGAHWSAAALPCVPDRAPSHEAPEHGHEAHAGHGHGHAAPDTAPEPRAEIAPRCVCGCDEAPPGAGSTARVGPALPSALAPFVRPPGLPMLRPLLGPEPRDRHDRPEPVPI